MALFVYSCVGLLCQGAPDVSCGSGSGLKASQKTRPRFKVSSDSHLFLLCIFLLDWFPSLIKLYFRYAYNDW